MKNKHKNKLLQAYDLYAVAIYRFVYLRVRSAEIAQDISSEVFLKCLNYLQEGNEVKNYRSFLYQVARNKIVDFYRESGKIDEVSLEVADNDFKANNADSQSNIPSDDIMRAMGQIKGEYRDIIVLHYLEGLPREEICQILGKSDGAVRVLIHRALNALKLVMSSSKE